MKGEFKVEHTFIMKFQTDAKDWRVHLSKALNQLCKDTNGGIAIFELNEIGKEKAEAIIKGN